MADLPDAPSVPLQVKLANMWVNNKPLAIFLIVLAILIILGIIFLIIWFAVIVPNRNKNNDQYQEQTVKSSQVEVVPPPAGNGSSGTTTQTTTRTEIAADTSHYLALRHHWLLWTIRYLTSPIILYLSLTCHTISWKIGSQVKFKKIIQLGLPIDFPSFPSSTSSVQDLLLSMTPQPLFLIQELRSFLTVFLNASNIYTIFFSFPWQPQRTSLFLFSAQSLSLIVNASLADL